MALIEVRLRPTGPWRAGHGAGDREQVDPVYHSDSLYSAITHAMRSLGWLDEWLAATARAEALPAVRFSSLFPFAGRTRLIAPPKTAWPPPNPGKLYLEGAKVVPLEVVQGGVLDESRWSADGATEALIPSGSAAPFHVSIRSAAAVDRLTGATEPHRIACIEFAPHAGLWGVFDVTDSLWERRVKSAFRLLADSGFGGERSRGWGRANAPEFSNAASLFPARPNGMWWLLSLYSPHESDQVDWTRAGYSSIARGGWTDSPSGSRPKKLVRMIEEGSVLPAAGMRGRAVDVAPDGFAHPVYRSGFALAVPLPPPIEIAPRSAARPAPAAAPREAAPQPEAQAQPEQAAPQPEPQTQPEQAAPQPEPPTQPEQAASQPESQAQPEQTASQQEPQAQPEQAAPQPEPQAQPEHAAPEPAPQAQPEQAVPQPEPQAQPEQATPQTEPQAQPEQAAPQAEPQAQPEHPAPQPEPQAQPEPEPEAPQPAIPEPVAPDRTEPGPGMPEPDVPETRTEPGPEKPTEDQG